MVHVANSPPRPQRGGCDTTDRPAITASCETELGLLPTTNGALSLFSQPGTIMSHQTATAQREEAGREEGIKHDRSRFMDYSFYSLKWKIGLLSRAKSTTVPSMALCKTWEIKGAAPFSKDFVVFHDLWFSVFFTGLFLLWQKHWSKTWSHVCLCEWQQCKQSVVFFPQKSNNLSEQNRVLKAVLQLFT